MSDCCNYYDVVFYYDGNNDDDDDYNDDDDSCLLSKYRCQKTKITCKSCLFLVSTFLQMNTTLFYQRPN